MPYESPFEMPDEYMRLVGIIACHWEALDLTIQGAIADMGGHDFSEVGILTDNIGFRTKLDLLLAYARPIETTHPGTWKEVTGTVQTLRDAYSKRNAFVHAKWHREDAIDKPLRVVNRVQGGKRKRAMVPTDASELEEAAHFIDQAGQRLSDLLALLEATLPPSSNTRA